jgi:hypothetical protein
MAITGAATADKPVFYLSLTSLAVQNRQLVALKRTKGAKTRPQMVFNPLKIGQNQPL